MWSNQKMKFTTFIHNDDVKCFYVVVQGTHKLVMMGRINFKDDVLIRRQWANERMNVTSNIFVQRHEKEVIIESGLHLLLEVVHVFEVLEFIAI